MAKKTVVTIQGDTLQGTLKNVFLAGLGAIDMAIEESQKNFDSLVKKGVAAQRKWNLDVTGVDKKVKELRKDLEKRAKGVKDEAEKNLKKVSTKIKEATSNII